MKTNFFFKAVLVIVLAMVTEVSMAQRVVNGINTRDAKACMEYLVKNQKDTIASVSSFIKGQDTCVVRRVVFLSATNKLMARQDTTIYRTTVEEKAVINPTTAAALEETSVDTRFTEAVVGRDSKRDTYYAICDSVKGVSEDDPDAGKVVLRSADKYGWGVNFYAGYQLAENVNSPVVGAGLEYNRSWWAVGLQGEVGKSKYTHNAVNAGKDYWSFRAESWAAVQPFKFDAYNQNRLFFFGGIGFESYETDSKETTDDAGNKVSFRSWGNYMYPTAGVRFEHRFFSTGNSLYLTAQWRRLSGIIQNSSSERYNALMLSVGFNFGVFRNKVGMSKSEVRALAH